MSGQDGRVRSGRTGPVVAVTAPRGAAGAAVLDRLVAAAQTPGGPAEVIAIDVEPGERPGVTWRVGDVADPAVVGCLEGVDTVVHIAASTDLARSLSVPAPNRRARAIRSVQAVSTAAAAAGATRLVAVTSASVYGAAVDNPVPLAEDGPLRAQPDDGLIGDLLEVERVLSRVPGVHPGLRLTLIRPAALVGPRVDTVVTRHFEAPRLLAVRGSRMLWQFCHVEDLADAVHTALVAELDGVLTVGSEPALPTEEVERLSGLRRIELPPTFAFGTAERLHRLGVLPTPAADLSLVVHPWVVGAQRLREAGWRPRHDTAQCLAVVMEQVQGRHTAVAGVRVERREAALGAAGATVALVGTAALLRQARARRRRPML